MSKNVSLVMTSISSPNKVMKTFAEMALNQNVRFVLIGDRKSPDNFSLNGCEFYSISRQKELKSKLAALIPVNHYSRKNIGYLLAKDADVIYETDDDNYPLNNFTFFEKEKIEARILNHKDWVNVYNFFSDGECWPRGLPLEKRSERIGVVHSDFVDAPIIQGLVNENPDVDAIYRLTHQLPFNFRSDKPVALSEGCWSPFNSQNTFWRKEAFPLLYLPYSCSFRMTDIWRSFIAQRIMWTCGWKMIFQEAKVYQERNEHNLMRDLADEIPGFDNNDKIKTILEDLDLKSGVENMQENLLRCYKRLTEEKIFHSNELTLVEHWCDEGRGGVIDN